MKLFWDQLRISKAFLVSNQHFIPLEMLESHMLFTQTCSGCSFSSPHVRLEKYLPVQHSVCLSVSPCKAKFQKLIILGTEVLSVCFFAGLCRIQPNATFTNLPETVLSLMFSPFLRSVALNTFLLGWGLPRLSGEDPPAKQRQGLIPGLGRCPGEGNGNPLQYSCLGNPMNRGACQAP